MISINPFRIVRIFGLYFILFIGQSHANLMTIMKLQAISGGYAVMQIGVGSEIEFLGRNYAADRDGYVALGFGREVAGLHEIQLTTANGDKDTMTVWIDTRDYVIQRIEGVDMSRVTPPDSVSERIIREAQQVNEARATSSDLNFWRTEQFQIPAKGVITGVYGSQRFYNGIARSPHWGIDYAAPVGSPVVAPAGGQVVLAEDDLYFSGGTVVLDHGGGLTSSFLHLSAIHVKVGQMVSQGDRIADIGSTGRVTGPHLDWRMNLHGDRIDAALWLLEESTMGNVNEK